MNLLRTIRNIAHEPWLDWAICSSTDPDVFYPNQGESPARAKLICRDCPVQSECLDWALRTNERFGVWGGKSDQEREKLRRKRQRSTA